MYLYPPYYEIYQFNQSIFLVLYYFRFVIKGDQYSRSHTIRSVTMFDESGYPKYNLELEKDKPVALTFDVTSDHKEDLQNEDNHLPLNKEEGQGNNARHEDLVCAFWDSHSLNWSSKGCNTLVKDEKIVENLLSTGNSNRQKQTQT